jgi:hypothetical protein
VKRRSPTLEGFQTIFRLPLIGLAEISWRWSFGLAAAAGLLFALREYLATLPVTAGEILLLRTRQPTLILQALARIFHGSVPRAAAAIVLLVLALSVAWIVVASVGRAATLRSLLEYARDPDRGRSFDSPDLNFVREKPIAPTWSLASIFVLNSLRGATMLAGGVALIGAVLIGQATSSPDDPSPGSAVLIFWILAVAIGAVCLMLNWYLSLAAIFVVRDSESAFGALVKATDLCRARAGSMTAAGIWFGIAHTVVFLVACSAAALPLGFAEILPAGMVFGGLLLVALLYFAAVDYLYVGRQAAYVFMIEQPEPEPEARTRPSSEDDILSDIPGLAPPFEAAGS